MTNNIRETKPIKLAELNALLGLISDMPKSEKVIRYSTKITNLLKKINNRTTITCVVE